ncbi:MAG: DUF302 domain-containing protein [Acidobacteriota bacterium]|nr:DUF302 domain-containing protein [Acidobacteriota bacterium]
MTETRYGLQVKLPIPFEQALEKATTALKAEGFGVLTSIDVKQTLKQKLDQDFRRYVILGACNPPLAHKALSTDLEVGLLLPCNVVVYEDSPQTSVVTAVAPIAMLGAAGGAANLEEVAREADTRLRRMLVSLEG